MANVGLAALLFAHSPTSQIALGQRLGKEAASACIQVVTPMPVRVPDTFNPDHLDMMNYWDAGVKARFPGAPSIIERVVVRQGGAQEFYP